MNYFLQLDGLVPTGYSKDGLLHYLYKVKNPSQNMYQNEIDAFHSIVDAPNCVFLRTSNTDAAVLPSGFSEVIYGCTIEVIAHRLENLNKKGYCMVICEMNNQDFEYFVDFYCMPLADWNAVVRKHLIDEFLEENA